MAMKTCRMSRPALRVAILLAGMVLPLSPAARAEVVLDGTMGPAGFVDGPDFAITDSLGTQVGANLFHSFAAFNVLSGESATFLGPVTIDTVIARVTGGDPSQINGPLRCAIPGADLYVLNPAGILFGPQAELDIQGSFYGSTASSLALGQTGVVDVLNPANDLLTMDPPQAFGFVGPEANTITVTSSTLAVGEGEGITLVGGSLQLRNDKEVPLLQAPGGKVELLAIAGAVEADVEAGRVVADPGCSLGVLTITHVGGAVGGGLADIDVGSVQNGGGRISIRSGRFWLDGAVLSSANSGVGDGGDIDVEAREEVSLQNGAAITAHTFAQGEGGTIRIASPGVTVETGATVQAATWSEGEGKGGDVLISAEHLLVTGAMVRDKEVAHSSIGTASYGSGPAGELMINVQEVVVADEGRLYSDATASGVGGDVLIAADTVTVRDHGWLSCDTFGSAPAGNLELLADTLSVTAGGKVSTDTYGTGNAGAMNIRAREVEVSGYTLLDDGVSFSSLRSDTFGSGQGGALTVDAPVLVVADGGTIDSLTAYGATGPGGDIAITAQQLTVRGAVAAEGTRFASAINASSYGEGKAGGIDIQAGAVTVMDEGMIYSDANGIGSGGHIRIKGEQLAVMDHGSLSADSFATGAAGSLDLAVEELAVISGGQITGNTYSTGKAGALTIDAERVLVSGYLQDEEKGAVWYSTISSDAVGSGSGGEIRVRAADMLVDHGGGIQSVSRKQGSGDGGSITLTADQLSIRNFAEVSASSFGEGAAGDINIDAGSVSLAEVGTIASYANGAGDGGDIAITASSLEVEGWSMVNGSILASMVDASSHGEGNAGALTIKASTITLADHGVISSLSSASGQGGDVMISSDSLALTGTAMINSSAYGTGSAGDISVSASSISLAEKSLILSMTAGKGSGGTIRLIADDTLLLHDAALTSASTSFVSGAGSAGHITLQAGGRLALEESVVATSAENSDGGNIVIVPQLITLHASEITTSVQGGAGNGGNISLTGKAVALERSLISANAYGGNGGNILIAADLLLQDPDSLLSASSALGVQGVIALQAPFFDMGAEMASLPEVFFDAEALLPKRCVEREEEMSWFVVRGRDGLPPSPASLLMGL